MITVYSLCSAVIYFNVAVLLIYALRRNTVFLAKYSVNTLIIITVLGLIRLMLPLDSEHAFVIMSDEFIPWLENEVLAKEILGYTVGYILLFIWISGAVCMLIRYGMATYKEMKRLNDLEDIGAEQYLSVIHELCPSNVKVIVSPLIDIPQCSGLHNPRIYLPDADFSNNELRYILLHEVQHIKSHDGYIKLLFMVITAVFWWNPIIHFLENEIDRVLELRCDDKVISQMSMEEKIEYVEMMHTMVESLNANIPHYKSMYGLIDPEEDLTQRFRLIAAHHKKSKRAFTSVLIITVAVFVLSYFVIFQPASFPDMEENNEIIDITVSNSYLVQVEERMYYLHCDDVNYDNTQPVIVPAELLTIEPYSQLEIRETEGE